MNGGGTALFRGPDSLRVRGERGTLALVLGALPLTVLVLGWLLQHTITWQQGMVLLVLAMVYVTLSRGRLLGGGLRVHADQFSEIYAIVEECARMVGIATPQVFIRDDPFVPIVGVGIGEPYALVISGQYLEHLRPDELRFLVGRELAQIASGNARLTSLLSANGRENAFVSIAFGPWLRRIEYTADRVGLLCCSSLDAAISAIAVTTLHVVGRRVDLVRFAEQKRELDGEPLLRAGEWLSATPFATYRIEALRAFARDPLYLRWLPGFAERRAAGAQPELVALATRRLFVGPARRVVAFLIDSAIVNTIVTGVGPGIQVSLNDPSPVKVHPPGSGTTTLARVADELAKSDGGVTAQTAAGWLGALAHVQETWSHFFRSDPYPLAFLAYCIVLVALMGRTVGMLIADARVAGPNGERIGVAGTLARYGCALLNVVWIPGWFSCTRRVTFYDRLSRTRLVAGNAPAAFTVADAPTPAAAAPPSSRAEQTPSAAARR